MKDTKRLESDYKVINHRSANIIKNLGDTLGFLDKLRFLCVN
jgi:hypothetical protein